jgi:hypothetical protein
MFIFSAPSEPFTFNNAATKISPLPAGTSRNPPRQGEGAAKCFCRIFLLSVLFRQVCSS